MAELGHEIPFLQNGSDNDPYRPEDIEQKPVFRQIRAGPDHQNHAEIKWMAREAVWALHDERDTFRPDRS